MGKWTVEPRVGDITRLEILCDGQNDPIIFGRELSEERQIDLSLIILLRAL